MKLSVLQWTGNFLTRCVVPINFVRLITGEFSGQIFEKHSNIKFHENPPSDVGVVA